LPCCCDIPNNKKAPEPLAADAIAARARAAAPGERATTGAVTAVLQALEQARIVVATGNADVPGWSLIHDYLVEPIKLATEEQTTRSETAVARLDYFVARAQTVSGTVIPPPDLRQIRRDAPPAAILQLTARRLIRRSLLIGYGKPAGAIFGAALATMVLVVMSATEHQ
jgi:hypothetical protein